MRTYLLLGLGLFLLGLAAVSFKPSFDLIVSDGRGYYVYLPSLVIDGDLDFRNQMLEHGPAAGRPALERGLTPRGLVANRYPVGLALTLAPAFLAAHAAAEAGHAATGWGWLAPDGYSA